MPNRGLNKHFALQRWLDNWLKMLVFFQINCFSINICDISIQGISNISRYIHIQWALLATLPFTLHTTACPRKAGPGNYRKICCCITKRFKQSFIVEVCNCHIIYLSLAKIRNDFYYLVFKICLQTYAYVQNPFLWFFCGVVD